MTACNPETKPVEKPPRVYALPRLVEATTLPVSWHQVYVPAYSHVYFGQGHVHPFAITLSLRNPNESDPLVVRSVRYFDTAGTQKRVFADKPFVIAPLETIEFFINEKDYSGGSGANFLFEWGAERQGVAPLYSEAVMLAVGTNSAAAMARIGFEVVTSKERPPPKDGLPSQVPPTNNPSASAE